MIISCPACATRYAVPDTAIGIDGRTVRCAKCRHSWFQDGPQLETVATPAAQPQSAQAADPGPQPPVREEAIRHQDLPAAPAIHPGEDENMGPDDASLAVPETLAARAASGEDSDAGDRAATGESDAPGWGHDEDYSPFEHAAPFRPRRNIAKLMMIGSVIFAVVVLGATAWVWRYGLPGWAPATSTTFAEAQPQLVLDFPPNRQDRRTLPNGTEFFGASGTVTNVGAAERSLPSILIVMRDARERIVYRWEVIPPKRRLGPGESITINEAVTDVPKSAVAAEIGWKPG